MKRLVSIVSGCLTFLFSFAQTVQIATDKTTSLIFPFAVRHVDRGTQNILVQPVNESGNILLVKAAIKDFSLTNLSVVTTDGSVYSFTVQYAAVPDTLVYQVTPQKSAALATYANSLLDNPLTMHGIHDHHWDVQSRIAGIYIQDQVIYYQLYLDNQSPIDYDLDFLRFYIRDKRKAKRSATQETALKPLYIAGNRSQVKAGSQTAIVVALDKFTLPDAKYLAVEIIEKNGGRHLQLKISNRKIMKARLFPAIY